MLTPALLPPILHTLRTSLFPNNAPAPPRAVPSLAQQIAIKRACAEAILGLIPPIIARRFFAVSVASEPAWSTAKSEAQDHEKTREGDIDPEREQMLIEIEDVLDIFADSYMNKHLIFGILELCVVRLMPEVGEMGVMELMEARLGNE